jgi:hypothetical protein
MKIVDFVHIPKNCGTSIKRLIYKGLLPNVNHHDHGYDPMMLDPENTMFILRDPIDRFISAFYYSELYPNCPLMKSRDFIKTPSDLVRALMGDPKNEYLISSEHHEIGKNRLGISWVWTPQHYWDNGAKYVLFHDNLKQDFKDFLEVTGRPLVDLPKMNPSNRRYDFLEDDDVDYIMTRYKKDYDIINKYKQYQWKK